MVQQPCIPGLFPFCASLFQVIANAFLTAYNEHIKIVISPPNTTQGVLLS